MKAILLASILIFTKLAMAEDVGYEVEVIIFEDTSELYKNSENWPLPTNSTDTISKNDIKPEQIKTKPVPLDADKKVFFEFIDNEHYRLIEQARKLQEHANYKILFHKAWKQPGLDKESAKPVIINTQETVNSESGNIQEEPQSFMIGDFTLIMSRYLHVASKITLHKPTTIKPVNTFTNVDEEVESENAISTNATNSVAYDQYPLVFERRMRSKEIHYIDHPMGGMIVLATPFKIETEEDKATEGYKTL